MVCVKNSAVNISSRVGEKMYNMSGIVGIVDFPHILLHSQSLQGFIRINLNSEYTCTSTQDPMSLASAIVAHSPGNLKSTKNDHHEAFIDNITIILVKGLKMSLIGIWVWGLITGFGRHYPLGWVWGLIACTTTTSTQCELFLPIL